MASPRGGAAGVLPPGGIGGASGPCCRRGGSMNDRPGLLESARSDIVRRVRGARRLLRIQSQFHPYLRSYRKRLILAVALSLLYAGLRLLEPWPLQILFDRALLDRESRFLGVDPLALVGGDRMALLGLSALAVLVLAGLAGAVYYAQSVLLAGVGQGIVRDLREDVFHQLQRLALPFHRKATSGDLMMRMTGDMIMLREMILASLVTMTTQTVLLVSVLILMLTVNLRLTLIALVLAPILFFLFRTFRRRMVAAARKQRRREGRLAQSIEEVLLSIPMVQAYTAEDREDERFRKITKKSARAGLRAAKLEAGMQRMVEVTVAIGTALVLWFGVREVLQDSMTPGVFLVFLAYLRAIFKPVRGISKVTERTARASAAAERVLEILHAAREIRDSHGAVEAPPFRGAIRFAHVTFAYDDGSVALTDVSFRIAPGESVALVGPTGAGKTTLFSLLLRFHKPTEGRVYIDDQKIKRYTVGSLRRQISLLPQEPFIVGRSIRENLLFGKPDATDEELWNALRTAALEEFVRGLPDGLATRIRERGQSLSGGQKQRLAIARAVLKDSPIVLLDEPTTGLDARSEKEVLEGLARLCEGRTTIAITHRFSTIRTADRVLVLDKGRLVENGPAEDLLRSDTLFRALAEIQGVAPDRRGDDDAKSPIAFPAPRLPHP
ncbi:MAG: ATP-binding cassette domain-containing protein [Candidatus Eisenbacteria bacterium]|nr:ATP-binding cassette domain-containing protein [Candidatus Latescibacterota bacterium]MBD3302330.1 ATP-binding cassette domain-containing protein [Candidatus Eisenbacteria bacterium]